MFTENPGVRSRSMRPGGAKGSSIGSRGWRARPPTPWRAAVPVDADRDQHGLAVENRPARSCGTRPVTILASRGRLCLRKIPASDHARCDRAAQKAARSALAVGENDRQHPGGRPSQSMPIAISTAWLTMTPASRTRSTADGRFSAPRARVGVANSKRLGAAPRCGPGGAKGSSSDDIEWLANGTLATIPLALRRHLERVLIRVEGVSRRGDLRPARP